MVSKCFCLWLAAGYVTGVLPWCLTALIIKYSYIPYSVARYVTVSMGSVLLLRAWLGPEWVIKLAYSLRWLLTSNIYRRDDIGNAFAAGGFSKVKTASLAMHSVPTTRTSSQQFGEQRQSAFFRWKTFRMFPI